MKSLSSHNKKEITIFFLPSNTFFPLPIATSSLQTEKATIKIMKFFRN